MKTWYDKNESYLKILLGGIMMAVSVTVYAYNTFALKTDVDETKKSIEAIDHKIDEVLWHLINNK